MRKYRSIPVTYDGITFDSKREGARYLQLKQLERSGVIRGLTLQPEFPIVIDGRPLRIRTTRSIGKPIKAIMDFQYVECSTGQTIIEDAKGIDNPLSRLKRALVEHLYGVKINLV